MNNKKNVNRGNGPKIVAAPDEQIEIELLELNKVIIRATYFTNYILKDILDSCSANFDRLHNG